jgi:hypothetical protein
MNNEHLFNSFGKIAGKMNDMYVIPQELASIGLNMRVLTDKGITKRIAAGDLIYYEDGCISLTNENFNKRILVCYGTLIDQFRIKVKDLKTGEESIIQL